jgi:hypothetical protein
MPKDPLAGSVHFRVYPTLQKRGRHYFNVIVFETKNDMYDWFALYKKRRGDEGGDPSKLHGDREFLAMHLGYEKIRFHPDGSEERHMDIGTIIFFRKALGSGLIAHEMNHAALHWDRVVNGNTGACYGENNGDLNGAEERMNYGLYYLVKDCVNKLYEKKLL